MYLEQWHNVPCFNIFFDLNETQACIHSNVVLQNRLLNLLILLIVRCTQRRPFHDFLASWHGNCIDDFIHDFGAMWSSGIQDSFGIRWTFYLSMDRI